MTAAAEQAKAPGPPRCRFCDAGLERLAADLGMSPLANSFIPPERENARESFFPLRALVCERCLLMQLEEFERADNIFSDYAYFSSYSSSWLEHSRRYAELACERFGLGESSFVVELASNDGYLLQYFAERKVPILGIDPAENVARVALQKGIPTLVEFFGVETARGLAPSSRADLLIANNVLAHVPDLNDFVAGMALLLKPEGVISVEVPHLLALIGLRQFDTIYHEHYSYFSLGTLERVFTAHGLRLFDVEQLPTHGGSLRVFACRDDAGYPVAEAVAELKEREQEAGLADPRTYSEFAEAIKADKRQILSFLIDLAGSGASIAAYGAPAKGNTLLNYCGIGPDLIEFTVDLSPHKQGCFLPGSHIPVLAPEELSRRRPDVIVILPWNLREEIVAQLAPARKWGARFVARAPEMGFL